MVEGTKPRSWVFMAELEGVAPEEAIQINGCEFKVVTDEKKGSRYIATLKVDSNNLDNASKLAERKLERLLDVLSIATGHRFIFKMREGFEVTKGRKNKEHMGMMHMRFPFSAGLTVDRVNEAKEILDLRITDEHSKKAFQYILLGTALRRWPREAFLNFFKAIELISDRYAPQLQEHFKEVIPDIQKRELKMLVNTRRRIEYTCKVLGLSELVEKISEIVRVRNEYDVAHAALREEFKAEYMTTCWEVAKEFLKGYLKLL